MNKNVEVTDNNNLKKIIEKMKNDGISKLHILSDFDKTLTTAFVDGKSVPSLVSILRDGNYLTQDYAEKAHALYEKYHAIEIDKNIPYKEKYDAMEEWWRKHSQLRVDSGLKKADIENAVTSGKVKLRFGEFADFLEYYNIPLVIMSASSIGEGIELYLKNSGKYHPNIHIICNKYIWDINGKAIKLEEPVIHSLNKSEIVIKNYPVFDVIKDKKNVILLGDSIEDVGMVDGFDYKNLIKIGFLNDNVEENLESYKKVFDVVITNDSGMEYVNKLLGEIVQD